MIEARWASVLAFALAACAPGTDVVARAVDGGKAPPGEIAPPPGAPANTLECGEAANMFAVLTKESGVHRFDSKTIARVGGDPVRCIDPSGANAIAVDRDGGLWVASGAKVTAVEPRLSQCKVLDLTLSPTAMAFVWDPESAREMLYALIDGVLVVVNPSTLARTPIGKLALEDVRSLSGTSDGKLLAFAGDPVVTIAYVSLVDASVESTWQTKSPEPVTKVFVGGVVMNGGFDLLFGTDLYEYDPVGASLSLRAALFPANPGVLSVARAPCLPSTR